MYLSGLLAALGLSTSASVAGKPAIRWGSCDSFAVSDTSLSCAYFEVPLDYHDPSVGNARLALIKANATGERRGTVFFNPGGPGGSGIELVDQGKDLLLRITGGVYDIVSWDPRGVGYTTPGEVYCFDSTEEYNTFFNGTVELTGIEYTGNFTDPDDISRLLSQAPLMQQKHEQAGQKCIDSPSGKYLKYLGTAATVRDIISMADVLDGHGSPVNYVGFSYGTLIGSWLINMFPERIGRVVVDGVLNPFTFATQQLSTHWGPQFVSTDTIYQAMVAGCALSGPAGCAIASQGDTAADVDAKIQQVLTAAHEATVAHPSVPVTSGIIRGLLYSYMYETLFWAEDLNGSWPGLVEIVAAESQQSASVSRRNIDLSPRSRFSKRQANDTRSYTQVAVFCGDSVDRDDTNMTRVFEAIIEQVQDIAHMVGGDWPDLTSQCATWPVRAVERYQGPFNKTPANKVLIISNTYDPITPLQGAQALAAALGENAALMRINGFGHPSTIEPSTCKDEVYAAYMVNGTLPANDTVCEVDADFEVFTGVTVADILKSLPNPVA